MVEEEITGPGGLAFEGPVCEFEIGLQVLTDGRVGGVEVGVLEGKVGGLAGSFQIAVGAEVGAEEAFAGDGEPWEAGDGELVEGGRGLALGGFGRAGLAVWGDHGGRIPDIQTDAIPNGWVFGIFLVF